MLQSLLILSVVNLFDERHPSVVIIGVSIVGFQDHSQWGICGGYAVPRGGGGASRVLPTRQSPTYYVLFGRWRVSPMTPRRFTGRLPVWFSTMWVDGVFMFRLELSPIIVVLKLVSPCGCPLSVYRYDDEEVCSCKFCSVPWWFIWFAAWPSIIIYTNTSQCKLPKHSTTRDGRWYC